MEQSNARETAKDARTELCAGNTQRLVAARTTQPGGAMTMEENAPQGGEKGIAVRETTASGNPAHLQDAEMETHGEKSDCGNEKRANSDQGGDRNSEAPPEPGEQSGCSQESMPRKLLKATADSNPAHLQDQGPGEGATEHAHSASSCLLYTSPSPRDKRQSRMPSSA